MHKELVESDVWSDCTNITTAADASNQDGNCDVQLKHEAHRAESKAPSKSEFLEMPENITPSEVITSVAAKHSCATPIPLINNAELEQLERTSCKSNSPCIPHLRLCLQRLIPGVGPQIIICMLHGCMGGAETKPKPPTKAALCVVAKLNQIMHSSRHILHTHSLTHSFTHPLTHTHTHTHTLTHTRTHTHTHR